MAYYDLSQLTMDQDFRLRCTACATLESIPQAEQWVWSNIWEISSAPGFADDYAYAVATGVEHPGRDEAVISDGEILSKIQSMNAVANPLGLSPVLPDLDPEA